MFVSFFQYSFLYSYLYSIFIPPFIPPFIPSFIPLLIPDFIFHSVVLYFLCSTLQPFCRQLFLQSLLNVFIPS